MELERSVVPSLNELLEKKVELLRAELGGRYSDDHVKVVDDGHRLVVLGRTSENWE